MTENQMSANDIKYPKAPVLGMTSMIDEDITSVLQSILGDFDCTAGTIHRVDGEMLTLVSQEGMPDEVLDRVETIPFGKGIAGLAAERREPVQVCNLQTDNSGVAEPGARATGLEGTIAVPMLGSDGTLKGILGIGKQEKYEFSADEEDELQQVARQVAERWQ